jgi:hypothetical protein
MLRMNKVAQLRTADAVERLLSLVTFTGPILDLTYGNGGFWKGSTRQVEGCDINPKRAKDHCCSFLDLPFKGGSYEMVCFDPPFHPDVGTIEAERFGTLGKTPATLKAFFQQGLREAWRVSSKYVLVKSQDYIHSGKPLWMPLWAVEELGEPYEWLIATRPSKIISSKWKQVKSLRRNHADYQLFCHQGTKRHYGHPKPAPDDTPEKASPVD